VWSSPIATSTPPCFEVPAMLTWRKTSPVRSTPGPLAVPEAEDTVELALAAQLRRLAAPERGGREILVQARLEHDVGGVEVLFARIICMSTAPSGEPR
jgi:hypothetical protein